MGIERSPAFCTLYVMDFGNRLSIEESSTGGDSGSDWDLSDEREPDSGTVGSNKDLSMGTDST